MDESAGPQVMGVCRRVGVLVAMAMLLLPLLPVVQADDDLASSSLMTDGQSVSGNVDYDGDRTDWWKIYAITGDVVEVTVSTSMSNPAWWCPGDGYTGKVKLTDANENTLAGDNTIDDSSTTTTLSTPVASSGWIHLRIRSDDTWCNDGIDYSLTPSINKDTRDTDDDGWIDNEDDCDEVVGSSTNDRLGCPDSDSDGYSDPDNSWLAHPDGAADAFPMEDSQWHDSDRDGYGNNLDGFQGDHCIDQKGFSDRDRFGCLDSDLDGWSDPDPLGLNSSEPWPAHPNGSADAFPIDSTQWNDSDGDGYGDNWADPVWNEWRLPPNTSSEGDGGEIPPWNQSDNSTDFIQFGEWVDNATRPDFCPSVAGTSHQDRFGCVDSDEDGWSNPDLNWTKYDGADAFPYVPSQWYDRDNDGWGDNQDPNAELIDDFPDNPTQWRDTDRDGYGDNQTLGAWQVDNFTMDYTQWSDMDGDGYGDNESGYQPDSCKTSDPALVDEDRISRFDRYGCADSDKDGWSDPDGNWSAHPYGFADAFPDDPSQWYDTDDDGFGDNLEYFDGESFSPAFEGDSCPFTQGESRKDRFGCPDSDSDGWSDPMPNWLASPAGFADTWPDEPTQWNDSDGDGYGGNPLGVRPDACPDVPGTSLGSDEGGDRYGCLDTDGDGWSDLADHFDHEPSQYRDSDGDGWGDNSEGNEGDACPNQRGDSFLDRRGCVDSDSDGYSDPDELWKASPEGTADAFPYDRMQWNDSDGDGFGDTPIGNKRDDCPDAPGTSTLDYQGCPDSNRDGWSDSYGELNAAFAGLSDDPASSWLTYALLAMAAGLGVLVGMLFRSKPEAGDDWSALPDVSTLPPPLVADTVGQAPLDSIPPPLLNEQVPPTEVSTEAQPSTLMMQPEEERGADAGYGGEL